MPPNLAFASTSAKLKNGKLTVRGPSQAVFVSRGEDVASDQGTLVSRGVAVQQGDKVFAGPGSIGDAKDWTATFAAADCAAGSASATGVEIYAFEGRHSPLLSTFSWSQDITIEAG